MNVEGAVVRRHNESCQESCQGQILTNHSPWGNTNMLLQPALWNAALRTNAVLLQWCHILFKTLNLFNFLVLQIVRSHIRISGLFLSTFLPSSSLLVQNRGWPMLIASCTIFKFYITKVGLFSKDLTYDDTRHSDDDKDCRVRVSSALLKKVSDNKNRWIWYK